mmetsp:Transcript_2130/g.13930  ORF Transcript_2130/g.13930 Transcript_2130/m.13930 type:complete len:284 (-) Transcript_2130:1058-1909(-)
MHDVEDAAVLQEVQVPAHTNGRHETMKWNSEFGQLRARMVALEGLCEDYVRAGRVATTEEGASREEERSGRLEAAESKIKELETILDADSERYGAVQSLMLELEKDISRCTNSVADMKDRMKRMEVGASDLNTRAFELGMEAESMAARLSQAEAWLKDRDVAEKELVTRAFLFDMLHSSARGCEKRLSSMDLELKATQEANQQLAALVQELASSRVLLMEEKLRRMFQALGASLQTVPRSVLGLAWPLSAASIGWGWSGALLGAVVTVTGIRKACKRPWVGFL